MFSKVIKCIVAAGALLVCQALPAQKFSVDGSVELYSAYIWRGDKVCGAQISPFVNFHYGAWTLQSFGFLAIDNSYKEIDWDLSYKYKDFSLHIADYFYHGFAFPLPEDYFDFKKASSTHVLEGILCWDSSTLPLAAKWFTFVFGSWLPSTGENAFSSYLELEAYHKFADAGKFSASSWRALCSLPDSACSKGPTPVTKKTSIPYTSNSATPATSTSPAQPFR